ncbi:hypothetical protein HanXRQr2_Chr09g0374401 [Helianthus annuus]|uniref:Uncharacterized protein n=1 Tax=Helianthus annuus TaxID=4232 RepID=A0A9K3I3R6_HELAN|nr:hypothetical protein HanXRQr2_Chr09g0374401 [Helianthus annuus]
MITKLLNGFPDFVTSHYIKYRLVSQICQTAMQGGTSKATNSTRQLGHTFNCTSREG